MPANYSKTEWSVRQITPAPAGMWVFEIWRSDDGTLAGCRFAVAALAIVIERVYDCVVPDNVAFTPAARRVHLDEMTRRMEPMVLSEDGFISYAELRSGGPQNCWYRLLWERDEPPYSAEEFGSDLETADQTLTERAQKWEAEFEARRAQKAAKQATSST